MIEEERAQFARKMPLKTLMQKPLITMLCAVSAAMALSACELRREGAAEPEPNPRETPAPDPAETPAPDAAETPVISIIREEVREEEVAEVVEPFAITLPFPDGGSDIEGATLAALRDVLQSDALGENWPVILRGHTDSSGNDSANLRASRARAEAVAAWLIEHGVDDARIEVIAFGEQNPIAPNAAPDGSANDEGRAQNRRVDIEIAPPAAPPPEPPTQEPATPANDSA